MNHILAIRYCFEFLEMCLEVDLLRCFKMVIPTHHFQRIFACSHLKTDFAIVVGHWLASFDFDLKRDCPRAALTISHLLIELFGVGCQLLLRKTQGLLHGLCFHFLVGETTANFELFRSPFVQL